MRKRSAEGRLGPFADLEVIRIQAGNVSERLGHASATITLTVYQHGHPGMGREAADRFAALLEG